MSGPARAGGTEAGPAVARPPRRLAGLVGPLRPDLLAVPALLVVLALLQAPGEVTFDTKLDLAVDPAGFLERALHLWDAENGAGGTGQQGYGYLFPIGPFFLLGDALGLPAWVVQRLWSALLLVVAYEGMRRLARVLVPGPAWTAAVAGLAWALSPRVQTVLGPLSAEALPVALLPWALLPLVLWGGTAPRRAAVLSAAAVLLMGAANATLTVAVLPVPVLWIATRAWPYRRRGRLLAWWTGAVAVATAWWVIPLLLLGRYSPPFLDWIESASNTTGPVGVLNALRGTTHWVAYVTPGGEGIWPAGTALALSPLLVLVTGLVAAAGLAGLACRGLPERRFLVLCALVGLTALTLGHGGDVASPLAGPVRELLDGPLAPLRGVHKADPLLRLPLVLGVAHLLVVLSSRTSAGGAPGLGDRARRAALPIGSAALLLVTATPALELQLRPGPGFEALPEWWEQAAARVAEVPGRTLVVPGAGFADFVWGRSVDEPLQPLAQAPWASRTQVPLVAAGHVRLLDAVETVLESGRGSPALADLLARSGFSQVLVRNDLDVRRAQSVRPALVRAALERSPGLLQVAEFGPRIPVAPSAGDVTSGGLDVARPALELYRVAGGVPGPRAVAVGDVQGVSGGPEDLLALLEDGQLDRARPTVLAGDLPDSSTLRDLLGEGALEDWSVTDGLQRRERAFGRVHRAVGPVLTADEPFRQQRAAHDLLPFDPSGHQTVVRYDGITAVTASTSTAHADAPFGPAPELPPYAAVDGDADTAWVSASNDGPVGEWLEVLLDEPVDVTEVSLHLARNDVLGPPVTRVLVETDAGRREQVLVPGDAPEPVALPAGPTARVRITVLEVDGPPRGAVAVRELVVPSVQPGRTLLLPDDAPDGAPLSFSLRSTGDPVEACRVVDGRTGCDVDLARRGEEPAGLDRTLAVRERQRLTLRGTVLPAPGAARLLEPLTPGLRASASSPGGSLLVGAHHAVDGDPDTAWVADADDAAPLLELTWPEPRALTTVALVPPRGLPVSRPTAVRLASPEGVRDVPLSADGTGSFPVLVTDRVTLSFPEVQPVLSAAPGSSTTTALPVGLAEVVLPGVDWPRTAVDRAAPTGMPCGYGPEVEVDGRVLDTRVDGTLGALLDSRPLSLSVCGSGTDALGPGEQRVRVLPTQEFVPRSLSLTAPGTGPDRGARERELAVDAWTTSQRRLTLAPGERALLVVPESANDGWTASLAGERLEQVTVDGWQLAFVLPAGDGGPLELDFAPDRPYRWALGLGGAAALGLLLGALVVLLRRRPPAPAPAADRGEPGPAGRPAALWVLVALVLGLLAGPVGVAAAVLGPVLAGWRRAAPAVGAAVGVCLALAIVLLAQPGSATLQSQNSAPVQVLCVLAVGAALSTGLSGRPAGAPARAGQEEP